MMILILILIIFPFSSFLHAAEDKVFKDPLTGMEFVGVKGGCYAMGDTFGDGNSDEKPVHRVCLSDFYVGKYEVTQGQREKVMGNNPSSFKGGDNYPVENVSWYDVQEFISRLNRKTSMKYRLPTEAEWEYAARSGGKQEKWAGTSRESDIDDFAWTDTAPGIIPQGRNFPGTIVRSSGAVRGSVCPET